MSRPEPVHRIANGCGRIDQVDKLAVSDSAGNMMDLDRQTGGLVRLLTWVLIGAVALLALAGGVFLAVLGPRSAWWTAWEFLFLLLGISLGLVMFLIVRYRFGTRSIRTRFLVGFAMTALLPAVAITVGMMFLGYVSGRQQAIDRLESVVARKELELAVWSGELHHELLGALNERYAEERISVALGLAGENRHSELYTGALRVRLRRLVEQSRDFQEIFLLDRQGKVVLSTLIEHEALSCSAETFFAEGTRGPYTQLPFSQAGRPATNGEAMDVQQETPQGCLDINDGNWAYAAQPVNSDEGQLVGVLVGRARLTRLVSILASPTGLAQSGNTFLIDGTHLLVLVPNADIPALSVSRTDTYAGRRDDSGVFRDYEGARVVGVYRQLDNPKVVLAAEENLTEALRSTSTAVTINLGLASLGVLVAVLTSVVATRPVTRPLVQLVETATEIAAGDLSRRALVQTQDEVGELASAFNQMTDQLQDLINHLEQRVSERTSALEDAVLALERRAMQLQTSAEVSREISSILDIDTLLEQMARLIRVRFDLYNVNIYLLETGRLWLRAHSCPQRPQVIIETVGDAGLNAEAVQHNHVVLVNDVRKDGRYLADGTLPDARSELVVPLRLGGRVIGTLDVVSSRVDAFSDEDALVIQSLGDQIAVAIENANLYAQSQELAILEERTRLSRELHDSVIQSLYSLTLLAEGWRRKSEAGQIIDLAEQMDRVVTISHQALREMRLLVYELRPPALETEGLLGALHQRLNAVESRTGIQSRLIAEELVDLSPEIEENLFLVAQEALNNTLRHAAAARIAVRLFCEGRNAIIEISDDGVGFDPQELPTGGMGLENMQARAVSMGGRLTVASVPGEGTCVRIAVPVDRPLSTRPHADR